MITTMVTSNVASDLSQQLLASLMDMLTWKELAHWRNTSIQKIPICQLGKRRELIILYGFIDISIRGSLILNLKKEIIGKRK